MTEVSLSPTSPFKRKTSINANIVVTHGRKYRIFLGKYFGKILLSLFVSKLIPEKVCQ